MQTYPDVEWDEMRREIEMLHAENALKLTQILDLEQLLYELAIVELPDGSPCWCCMPDALGDEYASHTDECIKARQATEPFWKK